MNWNLKVPKILHVYWGGGVLPYIRFMTVYSFMTLNPDWRVILWYPKYPTKGITWESHEQEYEVNCTDYSDELFNLPIERHAVDFKEYDFNNDVAEVLKSDFLRVRLLSTIGGIWSDFDILFFRPMVDLQCNTLENAGKDTFVCICYYGHSVGFIMSAKGSRFFEKMAERSKIEFNPKMYQCIGTTMFNKYYPTIDSINKISPAVNFGMDVVYPHDANHVAEIVNGTPARFTGGSIGLHWYAGHRLWGKWMKETDGGRINLRDCIIDNLLK